MFYKEFRFYWVKSELSTVLGYKKSALMSGITCENLLNVARIFTRNVLPIAKHWLIMYKQFQCMQDNTDHLESDRL